MNPAALFLSLALLPAGQESDYPPPFPREGATKVLENERVVVWDVVWRAGQSTPMHRHRLNVVSVALVPGRVRSTLPDGTTRTSPIERVGEVAYGGKGLVHREEGVGESERRAILIELKEPPAGPLAAPEGVPLAWPREGAEKLLENDQVVVWDYTFRAGREVPIHFHDKDAVVVDLAPGATRSVTTEGVRRETTRVPMTARFAARGRLHREEHASGEPHAIVIELK